jgi:hypothetical protein
MVLSYPNKAKEAIQNLQCQELYLRGMKKPPKGLFQDAREGERNLQHYGAVPNHAFY